MVESTREVCGSAWKEVLGARHEGAKERFREPYREVKRKVTRCIYQSKKGLNDQFGRKMNQDVYGNMIVLEGSKVNRGKVKNCNRIKDGNRRLALE